MSDPKYPRNNHRSPLQSFRNELRREGDRIVREHPTLAASSYCFDILADASGEFCSFLGSLFRILQGYFCYDNGHPFRRR